MDVELLGKNHHKFSLIVCKSLLLNEGVCPPFCGSILSPPRWADWSPINDCQWPKLVLFSLNVLASFLHCYCEWSKWCYLLLNAACDWSLLTLTYSLAPLHSLVDNWRIKNRHCQKEHVTLSHCYLITLPPTLFLHGLQWVVLETLNKASCLVTISLWSHLPV